MPMKEEHRSAAVLILALACAGCGHVIRGEFAPNHPGRTYDFSDQKCERQRPAGAGPDDVFVRYLGAGGIYLEWRGTPLLLGPFFSNPSFPRAFFGRLAADRDRIEDGLENMDLAGVQAILVGHAHYDHLADVPFIVENFSRDAQVHVNRTGANMLAKVASVQGKVRPLEDDLDFDVGPLIRVRAVESEHAPMFWRFYWARGPVDEPWEEDWTHRGFRQLKGGTAFAFVIDLLDELGAVRYRIYYQDSASPEGAGYPPPEADAHGYDLAILCMASFKYVENHPGGILDRLHPRHVLVTHYEDFSRDPEDPLQFVTLLTNGGANRFLGKVREKVRESEARGPAAGICGPSSRVSTMPLPREWLLFQARGNP